MAQLIKGKWSAAVLISVSSGRPCVALLFSIPMRHVLHVSPAAGASILCGAATELSQELAVSSPFPVSLRVDPFQLDHGSRCVVGAVRIEWSPAAFPPERDEELVRIYSEVVAQFVPHLEENQRHHTILVVDTVEEAERLEDDPENECVICVRTPADVLESCDRQIKKSATPDPEINSPPGRGLN